MSTESREFVPVPIAVMTASDSRTEADDKSGKVLVERLKSAGHQLIEKALVPDDVFPIRAVVSRWSAHPVTKVDLLTTATDLPDS